MSAQIIDANGFIEIPDNPLSKVGIYDYYGSEINAPDKTKLYKVLRSAEELSRSSCMDSFRGMPLVNDHTMLGEGQTDPAKKGIDGTIGDKVYFRDGTLYGNLRLYTDKIKQLVAKGKRDLSLGYYSSYDFTPGTWQGQTYDAVQRFISGNHIALVDNGRMGDTVAVLDHALPLTITFDTREILMQVDNDKITEIVAAALQPLIATLDAQAITIAAMQKTMDEDAEEKKKEEEEEEDKKTETKDEDKEEEDKKEEKDENKEKTMDAAAITEMVMKEIKAKEELVKIAAPLVGTFDHSSMTVSEIAKYSADKLKLSGDPETALRAYAKAIGTQKTTTQDKSPAGTLQLNAGDFN